MRLFKHIFFAAVLLGMNACVSASDDATTGDDQQSGEVAEAVTSDDAATTVSDPDVEKALNEAAPVDEPVAEVKDEAKEAASNVADVKPEEESAPVESAESIAKDDTESYKLDQGDKAPVAADSSALEGNDKAEKQPALDLGTNDSVPRQEEPAAVSAPIDEAPAVASAAPVSDKVLYAVRNGESLSKIAKRFLGSVKAWKHLAKVNKIKNPNHITAGSTLVIPVTDKNQEMVNAYVARNTKSVTIRKGDTLAKIALRVIGTNKAWKYLWKANENVISNPNKIEVGTVLTYLASEKGNGVAGKVKKAKHKKMSH